MISFSEYLNLKETGTVAGNIAIVPSKVPFGVLTRQFPNMGLGDVGSFAFPTKKKKKKKNHMNEVHYDSGLGKWLKEKWVDISRKDKSGKHPACGASAKKQGRNKNQKKAYPKCRPAAEAASMSKSEKKKAVTQKRRAEGKKGHVKGRKPVMVSHYKENLSFRNFLEDLDMHAEKPMPALIAKAEQPKAQDIIEVVLDKEPINVKGDYAFSGTLTIFSKQGLNRTEILNEIYDAVNKRIHVVKTTDDFGKTKEIHVFDKLKNNMIRNTFFESLKDCKIEIFNTIEKFGDLKDNKKLLEIINDYNKFKNKSGQIEIKFKFIFPSLLV